MREVIDAVDEGNLSLVALHRDELPIDHQEAAEPLGIAVAECDIVVVRQGMKFCNDAPVGCINAFADVHRDGANARTLEMRQKNRLLLAAMIDGETLAAVVAEVTFQTIPGPFSFRAATAAMRTCRMAW